MPTTANSIMLQDWYLQKFTMKSKDYLLSNHLDAVKKLLLGDLVSRFLFYFLRTHRMLQVWKKTYFNNSWCHRFYSNWKKKDSKSFKIPSDKMHNLGQRTRTDHSHVKTVKPVHRSLLSFPQPLEANRRQKLTHWRKKVLFPNGSMLKKVKSGGDKITSKSKFRSMWHSLLTRMMTL